MERGNIKQEPLYSCCQCYEDYSWRADDLHVDGEDCWCELCYEYYEEEGGRSWYDLPRFIPNEQADNRIAELEAQAALDRDFIRQYQAQVERLEKAAAEVIEAERLNRGTTRLYAKRAPRHARFEAAIDELMAVLEGE